MKLTKGKLSKIQNKKKQSLKRYKKGGKTHKSKTFRKRKHLNLHNTSLKKYKGGQPESIEAKPATEVEQTEPIQTEPLNQVSEPQVSEPQVSEPQDSVQNEGQTIETPVEVSKEEDAAPIIKEDVEIKEPISSDPGEGPGSHQPLPPPVSEEGSAQLTESEIASNNLDNAETGSVAGSENGSGAVSENGSDAGSDMSSIEESESVEPPKLDAEPIASMGAQAESAPSIAAESLDNLLDYISTKIAQKLKQSSFGSNAGSDLNRDSFNSVADASETLAEA